MYNNESKMSEVALDIGKLPTETRAKLAELELELSEGEYIFITHY